MDPASQVATVVGVPLAAIPAGLSIYSVVQALRPKSKMKKWTTRVEQIVGVVAGKGEYTSVEEMREFVQLVENYMKSRDAFSQYIEKGMINIWFGKGKESADDFANSARKAWQKGLRLSTDASTRQAKSFLPTDGPSSSDNMNLGSADSRSATLSSPRRDDHECADILPSFSQLTFLNNERENNTIDPNQAPDYDSSDEFDNVTSQEIGELYEIWRQLPQDRNPWGSAASLRDRIRGKSSKS